MANKPSSNIVGDATLSTSFKYIFWLLPFSKVLPLTIPFSFYFMGFMAFSACLLYVSIILSGFHGITTGFSRIAPSSNCLNYFIVSAIAISLNNLIYFFACVCINISFTASSVYACVFVLFTILDSFIISCIFSSHKYRWSW